MKINLGNLEIIVSFTWRDKLTVKEEVLSVLKSTSWLLAIRKHRELTDSNLPEAKAYVEALMSEYNLPSRNPDWDWRK